MMKRWKEANTLSSTVQDDLDIGAFAADLEDYLEDFLGEITSKYNEFNTLYREKYGTATADSNNPKFPMHELGQILDSIKRKYKDDPNWDEHVWDIIVRKAYWGDGRYYSPSYSAEWERPLEKVLTSLGEDTSTIHEYEEKIRAAQEVASRDLPTLKMYRRALESLREVKKSVTKSITILTNPGSLTNYNALE